MTFLHSLAIAAALYAAFALVIWRFGFPDWF